MEWKVPLAYRGDKSEISKLFAAICTYTELTDTDDADKKRRLNVINCRRKRDRQELEADSLKEEYYAFSEQKVALHHEHDKLAMLLATADAMGHELDKAGSHFMAHGGHVGTW